MERCTACQGKNHAGCEAVLMSPFAWCECPCHTGEVADPLGTFIAEVAVFDHGTVVPLVKDDDIV